MIIPKQIIKLKIKEIFTCYKILIRLLWLRRTVGGKDYVDSFNSE